MNTATTRFQYSGLKSAVESTRRNRTGVPEEENAEVEVGFPEVEGVEGPIRRLRWTSSKLADVWVASVG